jgi:serpin B
LCDSVFFRAAFEVNEEGAEGGAASSMGLERIGSFGEKYFEVDHPFIFIVWDYISGVVLFIGRVVRPIPNVVKAL